jgi:excinuclease ABC subunit A
MFVMEHDTGRITQYSKQLMCEDTGLSYEEPSPNSFSFNSPYGACPRCKGLGTIYQINMDEIIPDREKSINEGGLVPLGESRDSFSFRQVQQLARKYKFSLSDPIRKIPEKALNVLLFGDGEGQVEVDMGFGDGVPAVYSTEFEGVVNTVKRFFHDTSSDHLRSWAEGFMQVAPCPECGGSRLKKESLWFKIDGKNIFELSEMDLDKLLRWFEGIEKRLSAKQAAIAKDVLKEIRDRLHFLLDVGLSYLTLNRPSRSLSGGESQRIRLATQIGSQLMGITYILDEPSIGLHQRDNHRLIGALKNLRDMGNTVIVVEHDKDIMLNADYLVDVGPAAGIHGGRIVAQGTPKQMVTLRTPTADYLSDKKGNNGAGYTP